MRKKKTNLVFLPSVVNNHSSSPSSSRNPAAHVDDGTTNNVQDVLHVTQVYSYMCVGMCSCISAESRMSLSVLLILGFLQNSAPTGCKVAISRVARLTQPGQDQFTINKQRSEATSWDFVCAIPNICDFSATYQCNIFIRSLPLGFVISTSLLSISLCTSLGKQMEIKAVCVAQRSQ